MNTYEWTSSIISTIAALINLGALVFISMQVRHVMTESRKAANSQEAERARQRRRDTIDAVMATSRQHARLKSALPWNERDPEVVRLFLDEAEKDHVKRSAVREYLDYLELMAVGVVEEVLDLETITRMSGGRIIAVADNYAPYIERRRLELSSPSLYSEIQAMASLIRTKKESILEGQ